MQSHKFSISEEQLQNLLNLYPNIGKNSHVEKISVEIAKLFIKSIDQNANFQIKKNIDLSAIINGVTHDFEIKGTASNNIAWDKLKVSSQFCYNNLKNGMNIIRITNIGNLDMEVFYLKYGEDFELFPEARWTIRKKKI